MRRVAVLVLGIMLIVLQGCVNQNKGINCIVLFDYSASLPDAEFDKYVSMFRTGLLKKMTFDDQMVLIPIDKASEMRNEVIGQCRFRELKDDLAKDIPPWEVLSEADTIRARFNRILDSLFKEEIYFFKGQRKRFNLETDIVGSLNQVTNYLLPGKNAVFVFSDMIQESPEVNLKRLKNKSDIEKKLNELMETAQIPDLKNSLIFVCGATDKSNKRFRLNKYFWTLFFNKANAKLKDYGYGNADRIAKFLDEIRKMSKD